MTMVRRLLALAVVFAVASCATPDAPPISSPPTEVVPPVPSTAPAPSISTDIPVVAPRQWGIERTGCPRFYAGELPPVVLVDRKFGDVLEICFGHFSVFYSGATRGPLWSATLLTDEMAQGGDRTCRSGRFRDAEVPPAMRATLADYEDDPEDRWDRGHLTPANDMPDNAAQEQTFTLANAVPQASRLNRYAWATLEGRLHELAKQTGVLYIVTGAIFSDEEIDFLSGRVGIPTHIYKAVYDPSAHRATVFIAENVDTAAIRQISLTTLERDYGVSALPLLSDAVRSDSASWRLPAVRRFRCQRS